LRRRRPKKSNAQDPERVNTLWREMKKRMSKDIALDGVDPLHVIERAMRYFFRLAQTEREGTRCGNAFARRHSWRRWRLRTATRG
jgi:hypothetical protein